MPVQFPRNTNGTLIPWKYLRFLFLQIWCMERASSLAFLLPFLYILIANRPKSPSISTSSQEQNKLGIPFPNHQDHRTMQSKMMHKLPCQVIFKLLVVRIICLICPWKQNTYRRGGRPPHSLPQRWSPCAQEACRRWITESELEHTVWWTLHGRFLFLRWSPYRNRGSFKPWQSPCAQDSYFPVLETSH